MVAFNVLIDESLPSIYSPDIRDYFKQRLIPARASEITSVTRSSTIYVDPTAAGGGNGSFSTPYNSISAVNSALFALGSGNRNVLFKRGTETYSATGLSTYFSGMRIGAYGAGAPPIISAFTESVSGGWTTHNSNTAYITTASEPGWIIETTNRFTRLNPFVLASSIVNCSATPRSFFWDSGTSRLYLNLDGTNLPGSTTFRYSLRSQASTNGITISDDLTMVEGLDMEGWGCINAGSTYYGIQYNGTANSRFYVRDCNSYYNGAHAFGSLTGGIGLWQRCTGGYCTNGTQGTTTFVHYKISFTSTDEVIYDECVCRFGGLRNPTFTSAYNALHQGFYAHNAGNSSQLGLHVCIDCREPAEVDFTNYTITVGDPYISVPSAPGDENSPSTLRVFFIDHIVDRNNEICKWGTAKRHAYLNCRWRARYPSTNTDTALYSTSPGSGNYGGYHVRNLYEVVDLRTSAVSRSVFPSGSLRLDGCGFYLYGLGPGTISSSDTFKMIENGGTTTGINCVIVRGGPRWVMNVNGGTTGNDASVWTNLATFNVLLNGNATLAFDAVPGRVELEAPILPWQSPAGTVLATGGNTGASSLYDTKWRKLNAGQVRSIGAVEMSPVSYTTLETYLDTISDTVDIVNDKIGPFTGDTDKNSMYGAVRAMSNNDAGFNCPDLTKDDGDGPGSFDNSTRSLTGASELIDLLFLNGVVSSIGTGSTTTIAVLNNGASANIQHYRGDEIIFVSGVNAGSSRTILSYNSANQQATLDRSLPSSPQSGDIYIIRRGSAGGYQGYLNSVFLTTLSATVAQDVWGRARSASTGVGTFGEGVPVISISDAAVDGVLDKANTVETGWTLRGFFRVIGAILGGKSSGVSTGSPAYRNLGDTKTRVNATANKGDRSAVSYDQT